MAPPPLPPALAEKVAEDRRYVGLHVAYKFLQLGSLLFPTLYTVWNVVRDQGARWSLAGVLRTSGFVVYAAPVGALIGWSWIRVDPWWHARDKAMKLRQHKRITRSDRYSTIGLATGGFTLAFVPRRLAGPWPHRTLGGASLGAGVGFLASYAPLWAAKQNQDGHSER